MVNEIAVSRKMIRFEKDKIKFTYQVAGIVLNGDRVLLHRTRIDDSWVPAGREM